MLKTVREAHLLWTIDELSREIAKLRWALGASPPPPSIIEDESLKVSFPEPQTLQLFGGANVLPAAEGVPPDQIMVRAWCKSDGLSFHHVGYMSKIELATLGDMMGYVMDFHEKAVVNVAKALSKRQ